MSLDLSALDAGARDAVRQFWAARDDAVQRQQASGSVDQGERAGVTAGKNMDGFVNLLVELTRANGLRCADVFINRSVTTLPGYYRPTKSWDLVVVDSGRLIAAIELKSQVGPSFGNNFNNRAEESIGSAQDFWTAFREGSFGASVIPFLGWLALVEDCPASRRPGLRLNSPHFPVASGFGGASYLDRYEILCRKLMLERLYTQAGLITSSRTEGMEGAYGQMGPTTSLQAFASTFAAYIASHAIR
jgi:hypothetical protein